jgi:hypothetical protein
MTQNKNKKDWRHLAEQASTETNPAKLIRLVEELNRVLREERERKFVSHQASASESAPSHTSDRECHSETGLLGR